MTVGGPLTKFDVEWGENEPNTADGTNCAVLSKVKGYRLRAVNCLEPKPYLCMAKAPRCPMGFDWLPAAGLGRSCYKIVTSIGSEILNYADSIVADKNCMNLGSRLFVPESQEELDAIWTWGKSAKHDALPGMSVSTSCIVSISKLESSEYIFTLTVRH